MKITCDLISDAKKKADLLVVFCCSDKKMLADSLQKLIKEFPCAAPALQSGDFSGEKNTTVLAHLSRNPLYSRLLCVGLGKHDSATPDSLRCAADAATRCAVSAKLQSIAVRLPACPAADPAAMAAECIEGVILSCYSYDTFITKKKPNTVKTLTIVCNERKAMAAVRKIAEKTAHVCSGVLLARDLANAPNNEITCQSLARRAVKAGRDAGFSVKVLDKKNIQALKMAGLLAVNQGSKRPPAFIIMEYSGAPKNTKPVVLIGKGITFDSGGISLKGGAGMEAMKLDMHGAATVIGTMYAAAKAKLPVNLVGLVPATENLPSGTAFLPGDILTYANGVTVEIISTDAEGRLILADGLLYAKRYNPKAVIDFATLTGACVVALGHEAAGLMGTDPALNSSLIEAGQQTCEKVWELPLFDEYDEYLKSDVADTKNGGGRAAGTVTAARFLKKFAPDIPWAHIDIAGVAMRDSAAAYIPKGGSGFGVRLMYHLLSKPNKK